MKSLIKKSFKNSTSVIERIVFAVDKHMKSLGGSLEESANDISSYGISGGFSGFISYAHTVGFTNKYKKDILQLLEEQADEFGQNVVEMVSGFGVFRYSPMDAEDKKDLYRFLAGVKCKEDTIPNLMAWFAAEEAARFISDLQEQE